MKYLLSLAFLVSLSSQAGGLTGSVEEGSVSAGLGNPFLPDVDCDYNTEKLNFDGAAWSCVPDRTKTLAAAAPSYTYSLTYGSWGACTASSQSRSATCTRNDGQVSALSFCSTAVTSQSCVMPASNYVWCGWTRVKRYRQIVIRWKCEDSAPKASDWATYKAHPDNLERWKRKYSMKRTPTLSYFRSGTPSDGVEMSAVRTWLRNNARGNAKKAFFGFNSATRYYTYYKCSMDNVRKGKPACDAKDYGGTFAEYTRQMTCPVSKRIIFKNWYKSARNYYAEYKCRR